MKRIDKPLYRYCWGRVGKTSRPWTRVGRLRYGNRIYYPPRLMTHEQQSRLSMMHVRAG